jgi:hypothetical protein
LVATVVSSAIASDIIIGITIAVCVIFAVSTVLTDDKRRPGLALFNRHVTVFTMPLIFIFAYLAIVWGAKILIS